MNTISKTKATKTQHTAEPPAPKPSRSDLVHGDILSARSTARNSGVLTISTGQPLRPPVIDGAELMRHIWRHTDLSLVYESDGNEGLLLADSFRPDVRQFDGRERPSASSRLTSRVACGAFALWAILDLTFFGSAPEVERRLIEVCKAVDVPSPTHLVKHRNQLTVYWCADQYMTQQTWRKAASALYDLLFKARLMRFQEVEAYDLAIGAPLNLPVALSNDGRFWALLSSVPTLVRSTAPIAIGELLTKLKRYDQRSWPRL